MSSLNPPPKKGRNGNSKEQKKKALTPQELFEDALKKWTNVYEPHFINSCLIEAAKVNFDINEFKSQAQLQYLSNDCLGEAWDRSLAVLSSGSFTTGQNSILALIKKSGWLSAKLGQLVNLLVKQQKDKDPKSKDGNVNV